MNGNTTRTITNPVNANKNATDSNDTSNVPEISDEPERWIPIESEALEIDSAYYDEMHTSAKIDCKTKIQAPIDAQQQPLAKLFVDAGLNVRASQIQMINQVKKAVLKNTVEVIEAPTAIGKSYAYLIGVLKANAALQKPLSIVVSTATVALQEQLITKDLPALEKILKDKIDYRLAKGRARYVCHRRLHAADINLPEHSEAVLGLKNQLSTGWSGDIDALTDQPTNHLWKEICNTSTTCSHKRCEFYNDCAFYTARRGLRKAQIIVVNHDLLLSHLALGDGAILPEFSQTVFIIDECHHLPHKALSAFSGQSTLLASHAWINDLNKISNDIPVKVVTQDNRKQLNKAAKALIENLTTIQQILHQLYPKDPQSEFIVKSCPDAIIPNINNVIQHSKTAFTTLLEMKKKLQNEISDNKIITGKNLERPLSQLGFLIDRCDKLNYVWDLWLRESKTPIAKWLTPYKPQQNSLPAGAEQQTLDIISFQDYTVSASPVVAHELLKKYFWDEIQHAVILCSATIRSLGSFDYYLAETGLQQKANVTALTSSLNYHNSVLSVPHMKNIPQQSQAHIIESTQMLEKIIKTLTTGGLCIFASMHAMRAVYNGLSAELQTYILVQDKRSKQQMISRHMKMIDQGKKSMIFGLQSFAEGVDLPGDYLTTLVIHKLPFSVPTDPIQKTKSEWLEMQGKKPFMELALPEASIKLTQMCGRLVRREEDIGKIIVLDTRLRDKFYGKNLMANLPDFARQF